MRAITIFVVTTAFALTACGNGLRSVSKTGAGPDEFMVVPNQPLTPPKNYANLPTPTPGGDNLADLDPRAEAIVALGGQPSTSTTIPNSDAALVAHVRGYAAAGDSRASIDAADAEFRKRQQRLAGLRLVDRYNGVYKSQWLDPFAEARRLSAGGVMISATPPPPSGD
jgi:hypothetical protein